MTARATMFAPAPTARPRRPRLETSSTASRIAMVALAAFSARLRWDRLGASGLYLDDTWVALSTRVHGLGDLFRIGYTSPGFVLFLVRPWAGLFGSSVTALQLLPFVVGTIGPPLCFRVARAWRVRFGPAVLGGVLLALAPIHRSFSANLKQYTAEAVATLLLLWGCSLVVDDPGSRRRWALLVVGCAGATVLSMSEAVIVLAVLGGAMIAAAEHEHSRLPRLAIVAIEGYGLFAISWYAFVLRPHLNRALYAFWDSKFIHPSAGVGSLPGQVTARLGGLLSGFSSLDPRLMAILVVVSGLALFVGRPALGSALVLPTGLAVVLATTHMVPLGTGRTDIYLYPTLALLVATGLDELIRAFPRSVAAPTALAILIVAALLLVSARPGLPPYPSEDIQPLVQRVERERRAGDVTIIYPMASFGYALHTRSAVRIRLDDRYAMSFFAEPVEPRTFVLPMERKSPARYARSLDMMTRGQQRIWLVGAHFWPDWQVIQRILAARGFRPVRNQTTTRAMLILYARR